MRVRAIVLAAILLWGNAVCVAQRDDVLDAYRLAEFAQDARLRQQVSITALGLPLRGLLAQLETATGVTLRASAGVSAWRAVVCTREMPLADLLTALAATFDLSWRTVPQQGKKPPVYELWQSPGQAARQREEEQQRIRLLMQLLPDAIAESEKMLSTQEPSSEQLTEIRSEKQLAMHYANYFRLQPGVHSAVSALTRDEMTRLFAGQTILIPASRLSRRQQDLLTTPPRLPPELADLTSGAPPLPERLDQPVSVIRWRYNASLSQLEMTVYADLPDSGGRTAWGTNLPLPPIARNGIYAFHDMTDLRQLLSEQELRAALQNEQVVPEHLNVPDMLHRLFLMTPINVIAEYYPLMMQLPYPSGAGKNAQEVMQALLQPGFYTPYRAGSTLLWMARRRGECRALDIPDERLKRWLVHDGWFGLDLPAVQDILKMGYSQRFALSQWASNLCKQLSAKRAFEAIPYNELAQLSSGDGTAISLATVLTILPPTLQRRAMSGQKVLINNVSDEVNRALMDVLVDLPKDFLSVLSLEPVWLQVERAIQRHWACDLGSGRLERVSDLLLSKPGESLELFRQRVGGEQRARFIRLETETLTLHLGTGDKAFVSATIQMTRFRALTSR